MARKIISAKSKERALLILYTASIFELLARNLFGPVFAVFVLHIGGDLFSSGTALAINTAVVGIFIVISGRVAHKFHTEKVQLVIGYGLSALVYIGYTQVKSPHQLFALEAISGIAAAIEVPAFNGLFSKLQKMNSHTKGWGDYVGFMNFLSAAPLLASGYIAQHYGFNELFLTMFAFQICCMLTATFLFRVKT